MRIDGGCHCGSITYEAEADPEKASICHCTDCQNLSGTAFRTSIPVQDTALKMRGEPTIYIKTGDSGAKRLQAFCPKCGSPLYATSPGDGPKIYNIRVGTARQRDQIVPKKQIWCRSQQDWLGAISSMPRFEKQS
jgi:hypothetical protein